MSVEAANKKIKECEDDNFIIIGVPVHYTNQIDVRTGLWVEYQKLKSNMMALYEPSRFV